MIWWFLKMEDPRVTMGDIINLQYTIEYIDIYIYIYIHWIHVQPQSWDFVLFLLICRGCGDVEDTSMVGLAKARKMVHTNGHSYPELISRSPWVVGSCIVYHSLSLYLCVWLLYLNSSVEDRLCERAVCDRDVCERVVCDWVVCVWKTALHTEFATTDLGI